MTLKQFSHILSVSDEMDELMLNKEVFIVTLFLSLAFQSEGYFEPLVYLQLRINKRLTFKVTFQSCFYVSPARLLS